MNVLVVDDHRLFLKIFSRLLSGFKCINKVFEATDGEAALKIVAQNTSIQLVFLDIRMRGMDGFELFNQLSRKYPAIRTVVVTQYDSVDVIVHFMQLGVKGYLTKDVDVDEIEKTILAIQQGDSYFPAHVFEKIKNSLGSLAQKSNLQLSPQEKKIVLLLQQGMTSKEVATRMQLSVKTVSCYREKLLGKTNNRNVAQLISWAHNNGLIS